MPTDDVCELAIPSLGVTLDNWTSYTYSQQFLNPVDAWEFTVGDNRIPVGLGSKLLPGLLVVLKVNGITQGEGRIDDVEYSMDRGGGTTLHISGRGPLADALDSNIDPRRKFNEKDNLETLISNVLGDFGFWNFDIDQEALQSIQRGNLYGVKLTKGGKKKGPKPLKSFVLHQCKPYDHEGAYAFCERVAKRYGLHVWAGPDAKSIIVGKPNFSQGPSHHLIRRRGEAGKDNNILSGTFRRSRADQPSCIVATGRGAGGAQAKATSKVIAINELVARGADGELVPAVKKLLAANKGARVLGPDDYDAQVFPPLLLNPYPTARPMYLVDEESSDQAQVINFAKRALAERQQKAVSAHYAIAGHTINQVPFTVDSIVSVDDEAANFHGEMYVTGRTLTRSRDAGSVTLLDLILPGTLAI